MDLDLRRLRYFVAVAQQGGFLKAAEFLHLTQPALTRQIQALEQQFGVPLLDRDRRGTELTEAGRQLLEEARPMLAAARAMERRVRVAARPEGHFTIGYMPGVPIAALVRQFQPRVPTLVVDTLYTAVADQVEFVLDGRVDVCFVRLPVPARYVQALPLFTEPRVVALPAGVPIPGSPVKLEDLEGMTLQQYANEVPEWRGEAVRSGATDLRIGQATRRIEDVLEAVANEEGFAVVPAGVAAYFTRSDITYAPLDVTPGTVALAQSKHRTMPEIEQFAEISRKALGSAGG